MKKKKIKGRNGLNMKRENKRKNKFVSIYLKDVQEY